MKLYIFRKICAKYICLRKEIKKLKRDKQLLSTQVNDLRYAKKELVREVQILKLENELNRPVTERPKVSDS